MTGQNEIRLNPKAMQQAIQHWLDAKVLSSFGDAVEVTGVHQTKDPLWSGRLPHHSPVT